jgi:hypothetical protein
MKEMPQQNVLPNMYVPCKISLRVLSWFSLWLTEGIGVDINIEGEDEDSRRMLMVHRRSM